MEPHPLLKEHYGTREERRRYLGELFDRGAGHYDRSVGVLALGTGQLYRRRVLRRAGVGAGARVLDVATGTGLMARAAIDVLGDGTAVIGLDPSAGMLTEAQRRIGIPLVRALGDALPFADEAFDLMTMGFALRHVDDLDLAFAGFHRVLRPGGSLVLLEITRPDGRIARSAARVYFRHLVPRLARLRTRREDAAAMMRYYWETIEQCVPPEAILGALRQAGFAAERRVSLGVFSEYWGRKAADRGAPDRSRPSPVPLGGARPTGA
jgi:demethylmenaquinone methyltransferase/2-methoxy-6-polyprenyl-1,4-benzoquinol methylase